MAALKARGLCVLRSTKSSNTPSERRDEESMVEVYQTQTHEQLGLAFKTGNWAAINAMQIQPTQPSISPYQNVDVFCIIIFFFDAVFGIL